MMEEIVVSPEQIVSTMLERGEITIERAVKFRIGEITLTELLELPICSVSGGKDSTALYCLMVEYYGNNFLPIFADTGHEHAVTVNYVKNLHIMAGGPPVVIVRPDFTKAMKQRRASRIEELRALQRGTPEYAKALAHARKLRPSGNSFLDMMLWKNRAPSTKAQFCTEHLKLWPIKFFIDRNFPNRKILMFTGIRAGESTRRSKMHPFTINPFYDCEQTLPLLYETEEQIFAFLAEKGVPPNPLYALGYGRVGCFPCIHANKTELSLLPDWAWDRLEWYENTLGWTWFPPGVVPGIPGLTKIADVRNWCLTSHGGRQFDLFRGSGEDAPSCMTEWSICE